jgi:hypothetical protein
VLVVAHPVAAVPVFGCAKSLCRGGNRAQLMAWFAGMLNGTCVVASAARRPELVKSLVIGNLGVAEGRGPEREAFSAV